MKKIDSKIPFEELPFHLEIKENATVFITSDLKNFALKARQEQQTIDVNVFIDNFQKVLCNGTLIFPTYTDNLKNGDTFDYHKSKTTSGAMANRVLKRKDFIRTDDPLHSVCIWGKDSDKILSLEDRSTFGKHSVFSHLHQSNAVFLFFDVSPNNSFTFIHHIEELHQVPYRKYKNWTINVIKNGKTTPQPIRFYTKKMGVINTIESLTITLLERNLLEKFFLEKSSLKKSLPMTP